jgi:acyl-CoA dehydrogenase
VASIRLQTVKHGDTYRLNGEKTRGSYGNIADFHCVLARTGEGPGAPGLSCFVVPGTTPGVAAKDIDLVAPRPFAQLGFSDCVVPAANLIGKAGSGSAMSWRSSSAIV